MNKLPYLLHAQVTSASIAAGTTGFVSVGTVTIPLSFGIKSLRITNAIGGAADPSQTGKLRFSNADLSIVLTDASGTPLFNLAPTLGIASLRSTPVLLADNGISLVSNYDIEFDIEALAAPSKIAGISLLFEGDLTNTDLSPHTAFLSVTGIVNLIV